MSYFNNQSDTDVEVYKSTLTDTDVEIHKSNFHKRKDENAVTYSLNSIYFDFKKGIFEINGKSVASCSDLEISCHNGEWKVSITEQGTFNSIGAVTNNRCHE